MAKDDRRSLSVPLYERFPLKYSSHRVLDVVVSFLLASLLLYRLLHLHHHGFAWLIALSCESWFAFLWILTVSTKWTPAEFKTYPERLLERVEERELPAVDMFVTTADPVLEPPIITVNTVLSLMAVDYPASKLACYVSDDGCSPLTYYSLVEASKFARLWVPFCKKYNVQVRAPFRYFSGVGDDSSGNGESSEFRQERDKMMEEYEKLCCKIEEAAGKQPLSWDTAYSGDLAAFAHVEGKNHPTIIKVIWENRYDPLSGEEGLPHLVYISREKRPKHPHHYKAGAMNVLTRVSGVMTNAPFMLNVDCDMYANNPLIVRHAMCVLLDARGEEGFVQFPQSFYGALKDDPFGNQMVVLYQFVGAGISGIQGPLYGGTGCFHRRKVIYGLFPDEKTDKQARSFSLVHANLSKNELLRIFGTSMEFAESAGLALKGHINVQTNTSAGSLLDSIEAANQVAGCSYESSSNWGRANVGWQYGSTTEDVLTGLTIHASGWTSVMCNPYPMAFLGCAPTGGPASLTQQKRWATGLLEILISGRSPLISVFTSKLQFRQCLAYILVLTWGLRSIPELCYSLLPAYCLITNSSFLPKLQDPGIYIVIAPLGAYTIYTLLEYLQTGLSIRAWWNNMRMARVVATGPRFFSLLSVICKVLGLSETVFEVTQKDTTSGSDDDQSHHDEASRFTFDGSPIFVPGTVLVLINLAALAIGLVMVFVDGSGLGEVMGCVVVLGFFWPFVEGLFVRRGQYGIPLATVGKSSALALVFVLSWITRPPMRA